MKSADNLFDKYRYRFAAMNWASARTLIKKTKRLMRYLHWSRLNYVR